jgi:hypothetical protein
MEADGHGLSPTRRAWSGQPRSSSAHIG